MLQKKKVKNLSSLIALVFCFSIQNAEDPAVGQDAKNIESPLASLKKDILAGSSPESKTNISLNSLSSLAEEQIKELSVFVQEIIKTQPENGAAYKVLGVTKLMENNAPEALVAFEKAMALLPKDAETLLITGALYDQAKRTEGAIAAFEAAFRLLKPDDSQLLWYYPVLSRLYVQVGRYKDAGELINRFKSFMEPSNSQQQVILGDMLMSARKYQEALQVFKELSKKLPEETYFLERIAEIYTAMGNTELAKEYLRRSNPHMALVGEVIPDFTATDLDGKPISLKEYRGKVVLLDFWAAWCGPCRTEMPRVKKIYSKYRDSGFEIIGVSLDTDESKLRAYIAENEITWRQIFSGQGWKSPLARQYGIQSIPAPWLIDRDGKLISPRARGADLERMLAEALKKK